MNKTLVAAAGEHFVAYKLSCLGYLAAPVRIGSPATDLLAATLDGSRTVAIQVKTTGWAERTRGRGTNKTPHHLEFPLGHAAVEKASDSLIFCFVDLRGSAPDTLPDVYIVPAKTLLAEYKGWDIRQHSFFRHHRPIEHMAPFKNEWKPVIKALS
ncbi:MAG: hypothetical protein ACK45B_07000 [Limisphaerales bacterium]